MKNYQPMSSEYIRNAGFCFIVTNTPYEQINAGEDISITMPSGKSFEVRTSQSSIRAFGSAWGIPVRSEELWRVINES